MNVTIDFVEFYSYHFKTAAILTISEKPIEPKLFLFHS
jgi:hypothetical protein